MRKFRMQGKTARRQALGPGLPKELNPAEEEFAQHCFCYRLYPLREYKFHDTRGWRLDFAFKAEKLAVEIEGGVHRIEDRFKRDIEKYNALARAGWTLLRYNGEMVHRGTAIDEVIEVLEELKADSSTTRRTRH